MRKAIICIIDTKNNNNNIIIASYNFELVDYFSICVLFSICKTIQSLFVDIKVRFQQSCNRLQRMATKLDCVCIFVCLFPKRFPLP